jgi:hypothetical protein
MAETRSAQRLRTAIGWFTIAAGVAMAAWRAWRALLWLGEYRRWQSVDPSAAELYKLNVQVEGALTLLGVAIAAIGASIIRTKFRRF